MTASVIIILVLFCAGASFVQRVSGFGFGIFIMTVLPSLMPSYGEATTLSGTLALMQSMFIAVRMYKYITWKRLLPILITFVVVSYFAVMSVASMNDSLLKKILGVTLILVSIYFFFFSKKIKVKPTVPVQVSMGTVSGLMGGFFAMQGPPAVLYFISSEKTKEEYLAITQAYFFIGNVMMTMFRAHNGFLTPAVGIGWCYAMPALVFGSWIGNKVFNRLSIDMIRKIVYAYMAISGVIALVR